MTTPRSAFKETTGVSRATFNYVRDNPGKRRIEVIKALDTQGYSQGSTSSLLAQMTKQNRIRSVDGLLYVTRPEYTPLKSLASFKNSLLPKPAAKKAVARPAKVTIIDTPPAVAVAAPAKPWSPDDVIESLNVKQAMAVFDALQKIFRL